MTLAFSHIGLISKNKPSAQLAETCQALLSYLEALPVKLLLDQATALPFGNTDLATTDKETLCQQSDLIIVVGGDGSLLQASRCAASYGKPVVGINRGRLGFLADIKPSEIETKLYAILQGDYFQEERFLLEARTSTQSQAAPALNDIVLASTDNAHMMEFSVYINDCFMCSERADGMIIASPTGSTAYALSGGGPIVHPTLDALVLVPMFSHTLTSRPIVVPGNSKISLVLGEHLEMPAKLSLDGQVITQLKQGEHVTINKKAETLTLLHPTDYNYYDNVRSKLHWGKKIEQD